MQVKFKLLSIGFHSQQRVTMHFILSTSASNEFYTASEFASVIQRCKYKDMCIDLNVLKQSVILNCMFFLLKHAQTSAEFANLSPTVK